MKSHDENEETLSEKNDFLIKSGRKEGREDGSKCIETEVQDHTCDLAVK